MYLKKKFLYTKNKLLYCSRHYDFDRSDILNRKSIYKSFVILFCLLLLTAGLYSCTDKKPENPTPPTYTPTPVEPEQEPAEQPPSEPVKKSISEYFPLKTGYTWEYEGEGNEFASYTQRVEFQDGSRYQLVTDTGGTTMANIFEVNGDSIKNVYKIGEAYDHKNLLKEKDNLDVTILKTPLEKGNKWVSEENTYEITDTDATITVPFGTFEHCIVVKLTFKDGSETYMHYKDGVGMLQSQFVSGDYRILSKLKSFTKK